MIRILIADDHTLVREGLKQLLAAAGDLQVVAEAVDGDAALARARDTELDLALLDMSMPGLAGIELIKRLRLEKPRLRIVVLSMHAEQQYAARAFKAGASAYLTKDSAAAQLVAAIRKVASGGVYVSAAAAEQLAVGSQAVDGALPHTRLSDREFEVFRMIVDGRSLTEIGDALHLSVKTVSTHKTRLLQKMNMGSTAELVRYAIEHQLVDARG
jgi:DNA-binding NarL/FixJ family response regulator